MPRLVVSSVGGVREIEIFGDRFTIGRTSGNDLNLNDEQVSRRHAAIAREGDRWILRDLGSSNQTWLNGKTVERWTLSYGDRIRVGGTTIEFQETEAPEEPEESEAPEDSSGIHEETMVKSAAEIAQTILPQMPSIKVSAREVSSTLEKVKRGEVVPDGRRDEMFHILFQVGKSLSEATGLDAMLETTMRLVFDVIQAERGGIFLGGRPEDLDPRVGWNIRKGGAISGDQVKYSRSVLGRSVRESVSVIAHDAKHDPKFANNMSIAVQSIRSILCVPLWEPSGTRGAIYLDNKVVNSAFTRDDLDLLTAIANLVAIRVRQDELEKKLKQEEMLRTNLSRYHSPDVVEMLVSRGGHEIGLEVEERVVTVLFADVAGSTRMAERLGPGDTADLLNDFFQMATEAIFRHHGSVNKFIGDEVMAVYSAPIDQPDHAALAVRTAVDLLQALYRYNALYPERRFDLHLGIHTGPVVAGNVGTPTRMEYTVLGDTVNVCARLCKALPANRIAVGEETYTQAHGKVPYEFKKLGSIPIHGRQKPVGCCEVEVPDLSELETGEMPTEVADSDRTPRSSTQVKRQK